MLFVSLSVCELDDSNVGGAYHRIWDANITWAWTPGQQHKRRTLEKKDRYCKARGIKEGRKVGIQQLCIIPRIPKTPSSIIHPQARNHIIPSPFLPRFLNLNTLLHLRDIQLNMRLHLDILIMRRVHLRLDTILQLRHLSHVSSVLKLLHRKRDRRNIPSSPSVQSSPSSPPYPSPSLPSPSSTSHAPPATPPSCPLPPPPRRQPSS